MKKRIMCSILMVLLVLTLCCGCQSSNNKSSNNKEQASNINSKSKQDDKEEPENNAQNKTVDSLKSVLEGKDTFFNNDIKKDIKVTEINDFQGIHVDEALKGAHYAVMDLDGDSNPEVTIELSTGSDENLGFMVLRYSEDKVFGYAMGYRAFNQLKVDGTFNYADSSTSYGYAKLKFSTDACTNEVLAYTDVDDNSGEAEYFIGKDKVDEKKFTEFEDEQNKKDDPKWYEFSNDNFDESFKEFTK